MKELLHWLLRCFGFQLSRIPKPDVHWQTRVPRRTLGDALAHLAHVGGTVGIAPRTVIDVGVADGTPELYASFPRSKFLLVEPLREFEESLKKICARYDATYVLAAAAGQDGWTRINITPDLDGSSILTPKEAHLEVKTREVPTVTLDGLVSKLALRGPFLVKVDAQSSEMHVLAGAGRTIEAAEAVILETPLFQFVEEGPQLFDIVALLKQKGFAVYDIVGHNYRLLDGALAEVDLVFVKEDGAFRRSHLFATRVQRARQFCVPDGRFSSFTKRGPAGAGPSSCLRPARRPVAFRAGRIGAPARAWEA